MVMMLVVGEGGDSGDGGERGPRGEYSCCKWREEGERKRGLP
jgi:hypothetical protein